MRVVLESLRFTAIVFLFFTLIAGMLYLVLIHADVNPDKYDWALVFVAGMFGIALYRYKGWGKVFDKKVLWTTLLFSLLMLVILPNVGPTQLYESKAAYSYGFPFHFLTLYVEHGSPFLIPNLLSGGLSGWSMNVGFLFNFLILYFLCRFILEKRR
ncbi:hypothetical protein DX933_09880 [Ornithinibacillus gellani]|uniref:hypothetical protein n=1 Tax=Ornithinibacillus gellani TaxID=2293253 RepID=UPI000F488962|nr:hypothetical protein [Ornithinibacillus gellani]TQS75054.1 hypothetical protein DX933_09880 [Ornithinibacillus gellani]